MMSHVTGKEGALSLPRTVPEEKRKGLRKRSSHDEGQDCRDVKLD